MGLFHDKYVAESLQLWKLNFKQMLHYTEISILQISRQVEKSPG